MKCCLSLQVHHSCKPQRQGNCSDLVCFLFFEYEKFIFYILILNTFYLKLTIEVCGGCYVNFWGILN